jgi:hypothetical protein
VLLGELPHRDFDDVYTGGLAYLNAAAFRLFGTTLWSMRLALFAVFLAWVPAVHYIASRFVRRTMAAGVTLLAVAWSLPNYPAPMPSWYNLFLATFGIAALLRFLDAGRRRWLFVAGLVGGVSFLVKVVGLYYVAGVLLFLVFHAHTLARADAAGGAGRGRAYATFATAALLLFVAALVALIRGQPSAAEFTQFVLPGVLVAGLLVRNEWALPAGSSRARFVTLSRLLAPFLLGVALPVVLFLVPYAYSGSLGAFVRGVFVLPARRLGHAAFALPIATVLVLLPVAALVALVVRGGRAREPRGAFARHETISLAGVLLTILIASGSVGGVYRLVLFSLRALVPVLAAATVMLIARDRDADASASLRRTQLMLLLSVTTVCSLVQFPFTVAIYFCYVAPLVALTAVAFLAYLHRPVRPAPPALVLAFCAMFAILRLNASPLNDMDRQYEPYPEIRPLALDRAGLVVPLYQAGQYEAAVTLVRQHARGEYIWASPDAPQLYFLSGFRNPTRSLFEFFDDTAGRSARILRMLDARDVNLVVLNVKPEFSPRIPIALYRELAKRYPRSALVEPYLIKWRD